MEFIQIEVARREGKGTTRVRRMRAEGAVPGVLYGLNRPNIDLRIARTEVDRFLRSGSHLVELKMGDAARPAILRELQVDPVTDEILHADFIRVRDDVEIEDTCHVVWKGRAKGTGEGGVFQSLLDTVVVKALPRNLPGELIVDVTGLGLGDAITAGELELEDTVELITRADETLCQVAAPKIEALPEDEVPEGEEPGEPGEPGEAAGDDEAEPAEGASA